ncbi:PREDICTED: codeine O-demethylase [Nelumbo nucifera]|uniref:Codeine O-demethylase n=2 Tax=Nelumbo nucifera TaxID=4432 RepID=A0A1U7Z9X0_NELNU|nr:PREDICTED: codeine O-demethylase [Nelumbo nucifera]XP_010250270.1 PREDICTED: codeine O-demethylase [Nelumbo nucifera]DAD45051.1 TPA_asm: hypothetical protein HUJ06_003281 [Nelumbo nucifera]
MGGNPATTQEAPLPKRVQELALSGDEPPARFIRKDYINDDGAAIVDAVSYSVPVVDLRRLSSSSSSLNDKEEEMEKLRSALSSWGLFQVVNHGITSSFLDEIRDVTKGFFDLPMEEKQKYAREKQSSSTSSGEAYGTDDIISEDQIINWSDRMYLLILPRDQRRLEIWPEKPHAFRETLNEYVIKTSLVAELVLEAIANTLDLEENYFMNQLEDQTLAFARFNYYPPCSKPNLVYGLKPHTDGSMITIVLQDREVEGLQVLKDQKWIKIPINPHALLVNLGDQMEIMSNGIFKSSMHRVMTNSEKARISIAAFYSLPFENEVEPADALINGSRPRLYRRVKVKDYLEIFNQRYLQGKRAIDYVEA